MIAHRFASPADHAFVCDAWIRSYRDSDTAGSLPVHMWRAAMWPAVEWVRQRPGTQTVVAHDVDDPDILFGFICADCSDVTPVVFYVFVKQAYRSAGIARGLFAAMRIDPGQPFVYSYKTAAASQLAAKIPLARWDAKIARFPKPGVHR